MTKISFFTSGTRIIGVRAEGHSGYAESGSDIVCAAVTSALRLTECAINDVLGLSASVRTKETECVVSLRLPVTLPEEAEETCQTLLTALMLYFTELHEEYPQNIEVMEV